MPDGFERTLRGPWREEGLLLVPAGYRPPGPAPLPAEGRYIRSRITYAELFGTVPTWNELFTRLRGIGLHHVMTAASFLNSVLHVKGVLEAQDETVNGTFDNELKNRVRSLPDWQGRIVYSPSQIMLVMKSAVLHSPDREDQRDDASFARELAEVLLMANDLLDAEMSEVVRGARTAGELARALLPHSIRSTLANFTERYEYALGRAAMLYTTVASRDDLRRSPDYINVEDVFTAATGLTLRDYFAIGWAVVAWFRVGASHLDQFDNRKLIPATFFSRTRLDPSLAARVLSNLMMDYDSGRTAFEHRPAGERLFGYDMVPFMHRPLYRIREDVAVPVSLSFLEARFTNGVYWLMFDSLSDSDRRKLSRFYGQMLEAYVREALLRALPTEPDLARRVFGDFAYQSQHGERRTSDVVALYPGAAIFFEVTATRFRMDATLLVDDPSAVERDFERMVLKKAKQLNDRIDDFRRGLYRFGSVAASDVPTICPVIVTGESVPVWTTTMMTVRRALQAQALLQQRGVEPLRLIGVDEVEMLEPLARVGTTTMLSAFQRHAADDKLRNVSLRNFLFARHTVLDNETLRAEFNDIAQYAARLLFGRGYGPLSHDDIARRAYELFERRGRAHGDDWADWFRAEQELRDDR